jgi:polysaccharide biosynthesis transport protein
VRPFDVREVCSLFYRRRRLSAVIVATALVGALIGNYLAYPVFESDVKILVERAPGSEIPFAREQIAFKKAEITQTQCELLQSTPVLEDTVRQLQLDQRPLPSKTLRDRVYALGRRVLEKYDEVKDDAKRFVLARVMGRPYEKPPPPDRFRQAVEDLRGQLAVEPLPNTDIIALTVHDWEPDMAAAIANRIAEIYLRKDVESQRERARLVYDLINAEVSTLRPAYEEAQRAVESFETEHHARLLQEQIRSKIQEIASMELTYAELMETETSKVTTLSVELARLEQVYDPDHAKVLAKKSELAEARRRLQEPPPATASAPAGSVNAGSLQSRIARAKAELEELGRLDGEYARLERHKLQEEELYLSLKKKREEAQVAEATRAAGTSVVSHAVAAIRPSSPRKRFNLLLGLLGGVFAAGAFCALLEFLDRSVRTPDDVSRATGLDVIWSVPDWRRRRIFGGVR